MNNNPIDILKELNKEKIEYVILRSFDPIEKINTSKDVDIYIPKKYKEQVDTFFKNKGWYTSKLNYTRFPHKQYIYLTDTGFKKIDIVYGLYYSNKLYHLKNENAIMKTSKMVDGINLPDLDMAMKTLILHICLDKKFLSEHNKYNLSLLVKKTRSKDNIYIKIANRILDGQVSKKDFVLYKDELINSGDLEFNLKYLYKNPLYILKGYIHSFQLRIRRNDFCIIGVDGSGKSSTLNKLKEIFNDEINIQYLGFKNYEINYVRKKLEEKPKNFISKTYYLLLEWIDLISRYFKNRFNKKVIIFDRYPDESTINFRGFAKILAVIFYKILYPHSKRIIYLYCDSSTSFLRKDDIVDKKEFILRKKKFDKKYLNKKNVISISTDKNNDEEVLNIIINDLNKKYLKYFLQ